MGRQHRKEDRHARKKTKIAATKAHSASSTATPGVGKQATNAGFVFNKNQFASLVNKGKARQLQQLQQQYNQRGHNAAFTAMDTDSGDVAEPSAAAKLREEIAGAAAMSNTEAHPSLDLQDGSIDAMDSPALQLDPTLTGRRDSSIKAYMRELRKVVDNADVLLEVVDARDPLGCRSLETERMLLRAGKKVVLILNKIDLVPKSNVEAWLRYLRHDFPTLAFKASTQSQRTHLSQGASAVNYTKAGAASSSSDAISSGSEAVGAGAVLQLIKNYSRSLNLKTSIAVGVFGAPNVGKSSLINSLKRARVCSVASTPGHTKVVQSVMLDKSVRLLDCPGIVFSDESGAGAAALGLSPEEVHMRKQSALLRNVVKVELVQDPITPVEAIMARVDADHLMQVYGLEWFQEGDAQDLLMRIAVQRGRMARGGKIDIDGTARSVLHDWNIGRIKYYTHPPALHRSAILSTQATAQESAPEARLEQSSAILSGFSEAFDLAALLGDADAEVFGAGTGQSNAPLPDAPAPRTTPTEAESEADIEDDHAAPARMQGEVEAVEAVEAGDTSRRSTLGKRSRLSDSDDSDADSDDDLATRHRPHAVPGLDADLSDDDSLATPQPELATWAWQDKLAAKAAVPASKRAAELATAFAPNELAQMAAPTGAARRKMKKLKKRAERAGAGLVSQLQGQMLDDAAHPGADEQGARVANGIFGSVALPSKPDVVRTGKTGSMFDVLCQQMEDEASDGEAVAQAEDYEEEL
ncbi:GTPase; Nog2p [Moesziomyces antarcticus]|uniref:Related to NUG1 - Nuclear GTPase (Involved in Ribosome biogenesis) n=1 Tax=Pseudozyma antarctica TaxID=84753 RepID=A0A5C3FFV1_PSEA2|nr:GTPase; Nog2p [Moesziomyces antarcticus]GAK63230.1 GTPase; Nog2p [Moesziomyces antarcticus]SPO43283.1 related to NUG1 - Nuclear GTPase (involved in Ribosome biogenesis) [Moesziomyces antarcticus]